MLVKDEREVQPPFIGNRERKKVGHHHHLGVEQYRSHHVLSICAAEEGLLGEKQAALELLLEKRAEVLP